MGGTALHHFSGVSERFHGDDIFQEIAMLLIAHGANLNAADEDGNTPLHWAIDHRPDRPEFHSTKVKRILHLGPSLEINNNLRQTPLGTAKSLLEHVRYERLIPL